jgi:ABC-type dipeptide/oligopeptide/nickel transport system permease component
MTKYVIRRLLQMPLVLLLVLAIIFVTLRLSGDPTTLFLRQDSTPEDRPLRGRFFAEVYFTK